MNARKHRKNLAGQLLHKHVLRYAEVSILCLTKVIFWTDIFRYNFHAIRYWIVQDNLSAHTSCKSILTGMEHGLSVTKGFNILKAEDKIILFVFFLLDISISMM